jgi:hypothetical protein
MTVYVDDMRAPLGRLVMCHMVADGIEELHQMAERLGVCRYYQNFHYDISLGKRAAAVRLGAREITQREAAQLRATLREQEKISREGDRHELDTGLA